MCRKEEGGGGVVVVVVDVGVSDVVYRVEQNISDHISDRAVVYLKLLYLCEEIWSIKFNLSVPPNNMTRLEINVNTNQDPPPHTNTELRVILITF